MNDEWQKTKIEADIAQFKNAVEDALVEVVDEPSGRKQVEIAYEQGGREVVEEVGEAYGVYYEPGRQFPQSVRIDWCDERNPTNVKIDDILTLEESEYVI